MRDAVRWSVLAVAVMTMCAAPSAVSAGHEAWSAAPDSTTDPSSGTVPDRSESESTVPESPTPDTSPETTEPGATESTSTESTSTEETLVAAGDPDDDVDTTTAAIAIVGFILLVAVASWWMVRRSDPDAEPMPRREDRTGPPSDLI